MQAQLAQKPRINLVLPQHEQHVFAKMFVIVLHMQGLPVMQA